MAGTAARRPESPRNPEGAVVMLWAWDQQLYLRVFLALNPKPQTLNPKSTLYNTTTGGPSGQNSAATAARELTVLTGTPLRLWMSGFGGRGL